MRNDVKTNGLQTYSDVPRKLLIFHSKHSELKHVKRMSKINECRSAIKNKESNVNDEILISKKFLQLEKARKTV